MLRLFLSYFTSLFVECLTKQKGGFNEKQNTNILHMAYGFVLIDAIKAHIRYLLYTIGIYRKPQISKIWGFLTLKSMLFREPHKLWHEITDEEGDEV